nr:zinc finger, CCHC-type [Tanacetum cinerariifolium]
MTEEDVLLAFQHECGVLTTPMPKDGGDNPTVEQLGSHLYIKESLKVQGNNKVNGNNVVVPLVVNMMERNNSSRYNENRGATMHVCKDRCWFMTYESLNDGSILHMRNESTSLVHGRGCLDLRLGLVHFKRMQDMSKDGLISAFDMDTKKFKTCMLTKTTKKPFQIVKHETKILELIYSDLCYLHATPSLENKKYFVTFINDASRFCYVFLLHLKEEALDKFKIFKTEVELQQGSLIKRFRTDRGGKYMNTMYFHSVDIIHETTAPYIPQQNGISKRKNKELRTKKKPNLNYLGVWGCRVIVRLLDPKLKTLGERGIECIFIGYAKHSKAFRFYVIEPNDSFSINSIIESKNAIFDENRFSSVSRPSQRSFVNETKDSGGLVVLEKSLMSLIIHQMDVKTAFLNGELYEEVYMNQPQGFIMPDNENNVCKLIKSLYGVKQAPKHWHQKFDKVGLSNGYLLNQANEYVYSKFVKSGKRVIICLYVDDMLIFGTDQVQVDLIKEFLSSKFSMKDMREADVILGSNSRVIGFLMYVMTCTRPDIAFVVGKLSRYTSNHALAAAGKKAEWLKKLLLEIPLWVKPITPISIRCDSAATLTKAYIQMYNVKSRHLGVKHSMIRELITNGMVSIEFVRSQQNLVDHFTKGLARDLAIKYTEGMGLKSN